MNLKALPSTAIMHVNTIRKSVLNTVCFTCLRVIGCQTGELIEHIVMYNLVNISFDSKIIAMGFIIDEQ